jgi:acylphosphatase
MTEVNRVEIHAEMDADNEAVEALQDWLDNAPGALTVSEVDIDGETLYSLRKPDNRPVIEPE